MDIAIQTDVAAIVPYSPAANGSARNNRGTRHDHTPSLSVISSSERRRPRRPLQPAALPALPCLDSRGRYVRYAHTHTSTPDYPSDSARAHAQHTLHDLYILLYHNIYFIVPQIK